MICALGNGGSQDSAIFHFVWVAATEEFRQSVALQ